MSMASEVRTPLADRILAYMNLRPPPDRLYRRSELDVLGPRRAVDQALVALTEAQRVGSPGPGIWFPLAADGAARLPPAPLKEMGEALLRREGVTLVTSPQERDHYRYHATGGKRACGAYRRLKILGWNLPHRCFCNGAEARSTPFTMRSAPCPQTHLEIRGQG